MYYLSPYLTGMRQLEAGTNVVRLSHDSLAKYFGKKKLHKKFKHA